MNAVDVDRDVRVGGDAFFFQPGGIEHDIDLGQTFQPLDDLRQRCVVEVQEYVARQAALDLLFFRTGNVIVGTPVFLAALGHRLPFFQGGVFDVLNPARGSHFYVVELIGELVGLLLAQVLVEIVLFGVFGLEHHQFGHRIVGLHQLRLFADDDRLVKTFFPQQLVVFFDFLGIFLVDANFRSLLALNRRFDLGFALGHFGSGRVDLAVVLDGVARLGELFEKLRRDALVEARVLDAGLRLVDDLERLRGLGGRQPFGPEDRVSDLGPQLVDRDLPLLVELVDRPLWEIVVPRLAEIVVWHLSPAEQLNFLRLHPVLGEVFANFLISAHVEPLARFVGLPITLEGQFRVSATNRLLAALVQFQSRHTSRVDDRRSFDIALVGGLGLGHLFGHRLRNVIQRRQVGFSGGQSPAFFLVRCLFLDAGHIIQQKLRGLVEQVPRHVQLVGAGCLGSSTLAVSALRSASRRLLWLSSSGPVLCRARASSIVGHVELLGLLNLDSGFIGPALLQQELGLFQELVGPGSIGCRFRRFLLW